MANNTNWVVIVGVTIVVAVLTAIVTANITGNAFFNRNTNENIRANSCDADNICEIGSYGISSPYALHLTSEQGAAKIEGDLTLTKIGQSRGTFFETNDAGSLTITPGSGSAKLVADLTLVKGGAGRGTVFKSNEIGSLTITPGSGASKIEGYLSVTNLVGSSTNSTAYVCVDGTGKLFRKLSPCV